MNATAVKSDDFKQIKQFLSGYPMGWERKSVWRVQIEIGKTKFLTKGIYASEASAKAAAKRFNDH